MRKQGSNSEWQMLFCNQLLILKLWKVRLIVLTVLATPNQKNQFVATVADYTV